MIANRLIYRVRQFWEAFIEKPLSAQDLEPANTLLSAQQMTLFTKLRPNEQSHALRVLDTLSQLGESHPDLLTAALLHDIGKIYHPLRLWERVVIVLGKQFMPQKVEKWGQHNPQGWKRPFVVARHHPDWGAALVQEAGASSSVIQLVREHQNHPVQESDSSHHRLLIALQTADNQN